MRGLSIRQATLADLDELMAWRLTVLREVFTLPAQEPLGGLAAANRRYYAEELASGGHVACFAERDGEAVGCGGMCLYREMPSPDNPSGQCAYLMNIYVAPASRGAGVGRLVVGWLAAQAQRRGITKIYLEATAAGRRLYEEAGFAPMAGMMKLRGEVGHGTV